MLLRLGIIAALIALYFVGGALAAAHATTVIIALMLVVFLALVALMYTRIMPALLALPILAVALACIAGMKWQAIADHVVAAGAGRLSGAIIAAILGSVLAQIVEKTGIAQTAIKKTAELGGDKPMVLAVLLTGVIALLFTTLGGLGAVIMVATIAIPILLSLGLRPLYVGCLFLLAMSLGGAFNLTNWAMFKDALGMTNNQIGAFTLPFAGLMVVAVAAFMVIEGKRMGKARFKASVEDTPAAPTAFVPWYALLTPIIPLVPMLFFGLLPKVVHNPADVAVVSTASPLVKVTGVELVRGEQHIPLELGEPAPFTAFGRYTVMPTFDPVLTMVSPAPLPQSSTVEIEPWSKAQFTITLDAKTNQLTASYGAESTAYDFPIAVALLLGILYGALATWRRGQSTVQLLTKAAFDGVAAVGPAVVLMIGIGMVVIATKESPEVSGVIGPALAKIVPAGKGLPAMLHYVVLFSVLAPLALYRGPLNLWGMGAGLMGLLQPFLPLGAILGAFTATGMIQGVSDPTNTHNVWVANYTNTDVQDILKRTLPYMWALTIAGLLLAGVMYYLVK